MKGPACGAPGVANPGEGERKAINPELWYACAGPLVTLPPVGSLVVYFPQGHSEQVAASMQKDVDGHIPNYPNLPSKLICLLHNVTLHADPDTDEVYAQMTLQPVNTYDKEAVLASDLALKSTRPQTEFFCKTLTASDTSTHGGFSVPRRAAEKIFPPLDFTLQPPAQELQARDLHDNVWTFRHIYRGQPKRHLLTTGWSLFVSGKRLFAGDSVLFIRDEKQQLLLGIRRANRQPTNISSSVLSSDSMHIGILAAAAHAASNNSPFTVFYNPRASPSEFVIPLAKYNKVVYSNQISLGMRFRMMFETEDSGTRRYMGTITGISDLDPVRWKNSQWRNLQVGWDESAAGEKRNRVSLWEIEPVATPFFICSPPFFRSKRPRQPGMPDDESSEMENLFKRAMPWLGEEICIKDSQTQNTIMPGLNLVQWMNMQQNPSVTNPTMQPDYLRSLNGPNIQNCGVSDGSRQMGLQAQLLQQNNAHLSSPRLPQSTQQVEQLPKVSVPVNQLSTVSRPQQQVQQRQQLVGQGFLVNQGQSNLVQPQVLFQTQSQQPLPLIQSNQALQASIHSSQLQHQQDITTQHRQQLVGQAFLLDQAPSNVIQPQVPVQTQSQQPPPPIQSNQPLQDSLQSSQPQHQQVLLQQQQKQLQLQQLLQQQQQTRISVQLPNQTSQQMQLPEQQMQLQPLQKLQQQQQQQNAISSLPTPQQPLMPHLQEQQRAPLEKVQNLSNSHSLPQQHVIPQQRTKPTPAVVHIPQFLQYQSQQKLQQHQQHQQVLLSELPGVVLPAPPPSNLHAINGNSSLVAGTQSGITDDVPSCSTSPSTNNCSILPQPMLNRAHQSNKVTTQRNTQSAATILSSSTLEALGGSSSVVKEIPKSDRNAKHSLPASKVQSQAVLAQQTYMNNTAQIGYLDSSSSATSVCLSQMDGPLQPNFPLSSFNQSSIFRDVPPASELSGSDPRNNVLFGVNIDGPLGIPLMNDPLLANSIDSDKYQNQIVGNVIDNYSASKDAQQELSSSMVSQSFGVPDMGFNSIDSTINDSSFLNRSSWAPAPQYQRMRTYTKVYKRGAVGRSIDITRYSGYDELKHDLARMFSIEGQLEDRQRIGWKLVYVDHENDVLLVGDDPWEEFVNCVRYIRILSPHEVQQMSVDGDLGNNLLPNQAGSSSDGGNAWKGQCDQNSSNPSAGSYDRLE